MSGDAPSNSQEIPTRLIERPMPVGWVVQVANAFDAEAAIMFDGAKRLTGNHWARREKREAQFAAAQHRKDIASALKVLACVMQDFPPDAREMMRRRGWLGPRLHDLVTALVSARKDGSSPQQSTGETA